MKKEDILEVVGDLNEQISEDKQIDLTGTVLAVVESFLDVVDGLPEDQNVPDSILAVFNELVIVEKAGEGALKAFCEELENAPDEATDGGVLDEKEPKVSGKKESGKHLVGKTTPTTEKKEVTPPPDKPVKDFALLAAAISAKGDEKLTYVLDKMVLAGSTEQKMFDSVSVLSKERGLKVFMTGVAEIKTYVNYREKVNKWIFEKKGDKIKLVGVNR